MTEPQYKKNWANDNIKKWEQYLPIENIKEILEVGCLEGNATNWFLGRFPEAKVSVVDWFKLEQDLYPKELTFDLESTFRRNINDNIDRVTVYVGDSHKILPQLITKNKRYDLIYIDGDHTSRGAIQDIVDSFRLLKPSGFMVIDDYVWKHYPPDIGDPERAINSFLDIYQTQIDLIHKGIQIIIRKK